MYDIVVAIDLETTGPDPYKDRIIEIGAVEYRDGAVTDTFSELCKSPVPLSPGIIKLTGITPTMLEEARPLEAVLQDFLEFLPDGALCIAHNGSFERSFLRAASKDRFKHTVLDTLELSRICFPFFHSHGMEALRSELDLGSHDDAHRALPDCEALIGLWKAILEKAKAIPLPVVAEMNFLLGVNKNHPYCDFFRRLEREGLTAQFGRTETSVIGVLENRDPMPMPPPRLSEEEAYEPLDPETMAGELGDDGPFSRALPAYETREGQLDMTRAVAEAFNERKHLCVEAGTGIGKSLAYLVPSVRWALRNRTPVVVSTNTKNLQAQLFAKDLPLIRKILGVDFRMALLKGRRNYLCLRKLLYVLRQSAQELDREERMRMLNLLPWAAWTETGDISENIVAGRPGFWPLWSKLSTIGDECMGRGCRHHAACHLRRARARALAADIVVANHSLVFADMNTKNPALPPHQQVVFDEAHNLEDAATSHLSVEISLSRLQFPLGRLYRPSRRGEGTGLAPSVLHQLREAKGADAELLSQAEAHVYEVMEATGEVTPRVTPFFEALEALLKAGSSGESFRIRADRKRPSQWAPILEAKEHLVTALSRVQTGVDALLATLRELGAEKLRYQREFVRDLQGVQTWLQEISYDIEFVLEAEHEDYVFWVERASPKQGRARAWAAPIAVGKLLYDQLYTRKDTVVFCSATLSVKNSFAFLQKRLGIDLIETERLVELDAGTPFDYEKQCLVAAPVFLPEPSDKGKDYTGDLAVLLAETFRRTKGRALSLFTSYQMLTKVAQLLQEELLGDGIQVLAQGMSGSRENITAIFKRDIHSVLLGTHSFWEGVDVPGEALSCLVVARLPFAVFSDPIVEARCERVRDEGQDPFVGYTLPSAVIRFRQGFGRLIRHREDRGVVIVADRRFAVKRYGRWFQESLPAPTEIFSDREEFLQSIEEWLET